MPSTWPRDGVLRALAGPRSCQASSACDTPLLGARHSAPGPIFKEWRFAPATFFQVTTVNITSSPNTTSHWDTTPFPPPSHSQATFPPRIHHKPESQEIPGPGHRLHGVLAQLYRRGGFLRPQARTGTCGHPVVLETTGRTGVG